MMAIVHENDGHTDFVWRIRNYMPAGSDVFRWAIRDGGIRPSIYGKICSEDAISADKDIVFTGSDAASEYPIKTFASGPTNSMTGAAFLAGLDNQKGLSSEVDKEEEESYQILVVDIDGTTTDVCALLPSGFPRQCPNFVEVGGVRTAFSMPELFSIGLGGGSKILAKTDGNVTVGPDSVGHYLAQEALVFGGSTLTASDVVVASGRAHLGDATLISHVPHTIVKASTRRIKHMLESVV